MRRAVLGMCIACAAALALGCTRDSEEDHLARVQVAGVRIDPETSSPVVELVENGPRGRSLGIWVGEFEAESIARAIEHQPSPRPDSHDLLMSVLEEIHGHVTRTLVTELHGGTYFAVIELELRGRSLRVDARPSDAIAVALRASAPVLVRDSLFRDAAIPDDEHSLEIDWRAQPASECRESAPL
ncbi:MAG TPA: bifunctional nuclease family protein [Myxococcota bacterium]|nr:bifunctional nuclease family protein [Myxococcota bacterium]